MSSVNKVILIGNAGRDTEVRYLPSGQAVANVSIATSFKTKDGNEDTQWHRITFFDRLAEIAGEYVTKGKSIYVEGRLKYGKYTDKDGVEKPTCDIVATTLQLLGGGERDGGNQDRGDSQRQQRSQGGDNRGGQQQRTSASQPRSQQRPQQRQAPQGGGYADDFSDMDSDIPF